MCGSIFKNGVKGLRPLRGLRAAQALIFLAALAVSSVTALAEPRIALVLSNEAYTQPGAKLSNTHRDGDLIAAALRKVGFAVTVVRDTKNEGELRAAISAHADRIAKAGPDAIGFLYYSGHGAADGPTGANYIIPTQAPLVHVRDLTLSAVPLDSITRTLARVGRMNFIVFDACRNLALQRDSKDFGFKGFVPMAAPDEVLIAFATDQGNVAVDQSLYARALADELVKPGQEANQVFRNVRRSVSLATQNAQRPEAVEKRTHDFQFMAPVVAPTAPASPSQITPPAPPLGPTKNPPVVLEPVAQPATPKGAAPTPKATEPSPPRVKAVSVPPPKPPPVTPPSSAAEPSKPKTEVPKAIPPAAKTGGTPHGVEIGSARWRAIVPCESREITQFNELCRRPNGVVCSTIVQGNRRVPVDCRS